VFYIAVDMRGGANINKNVEYMAKAENIKDEIKKLEAKIRDKENKEYKEYSKYDGLIILAGKRLQLGISLENVDIVSLFTNITASDAIYQMIFRSMTEIDDDAVCDGSSYCTNKKYGFMVDLNPQRTIYTLEYFADRTSNKDDDIDKVKSKYSVIADLINIDKDKFINKYETDTDNSNYVKEFFDKLYSSWEINTENIKAILKEQDIFTENIKDLLTDDFDIRRLFNNEKDKAKKAVVIPENAFSSGKMRMRDIYVNQPKIKKELSISEMWYDILSETISILAFISSYSKIECIFKEGNIKDFNYEILKIFDELNNDEDLKEIFVYYLKKRVIKRDAVSTGELFNMVYNIIRLMNVKPAKQDKQSGGHIEINKIIHMKKQKIYNIKELDKLLEFINANLAPKQIEKKERGEVFTPMKLVNEMLDVLSKDVWKNKDLKWLDPAAGMGNFPVAVYMRLMDGLKTVIPNEENRRKHILEKMLYMVELDKANVFMMKKIFCGTTYKLNIFEGSFINYQSKYKEILIDKKYNIILGNPPFQYKEERGQAETIWHLFVLRSYKLLDNDGYMLFIHPSGWRDITGMKRNGGNQRDVFDFIKKHNLIYLNMNDYKTGQNVFKGATTNFDYYVVQNKETNINKTIVNDIDNEEYEIDLNNWEFIPSGKFKDFKKLIATKKEARVELLYSRTLYGSDKTHVSKTKTRFPCCYSISKQQGMTYRYSNIDKGHFGVPKVIFSDGAGMPVKDDNGKYGLTEFCYGIVDDKKVLDDILYAITKPSFLNLMKYLVFKENHIYNDKIISLFKKDFYKYFLDKKSSSR
jgi:hypothetical protein